ncbi:MAG: hypothetical protein LUQ23_03570 [Methanomicrobiales archaeon]|nr:hypothetical protein [Methanomicrobiales archaeon]
MIRESLREALVRLAEIPALWITGLYLGGLFALYLLFLAWENIILARILFLGLCALPFFLGGTYGAIRGDGTGLRGYVGAGAMYYFRILLAGAVIVGAALFTALLVMAPILVVGGSLQEAIPSSLLGVGVSFAFLTAFTGTAIVFEDRRVLDSIRRSVEFVTGNLKASVLFYLSNLAIGLLISFLSVALWSFTAADRVLPLVEGNQTAIENLTASGLVELIGPAGLWAGVVIGFLAVAIGGALLTAFGACFFRRVAASSPAAGPQGEFDEKGRWYRY